MRRARPRAAVALLLVLGAACATPLERTMPACDAGSRLAILAQSAPDAAYVPCIADLPPGWTFEGLEVSEDGATIHLESDRSDRPVRVELRDGCRPGAATPIAPSDDGVRTYHRVRSVDPRFAGTFADVFPGGCVTTTYDFARGPHVALVAELRDAVALRSRLEVRRDVADELGVTLDP